MKKAKRVAISVAIVLTCTAAGYSAGRYAKRWQQESQGSQEAQQDSQEGYILIHTTDSKDIDIDVSGWLVDSTHDCYNLEE